MVKFMKKQWPGTKWTQTKKGNCTIFIGDCAVGRIHSHGNGFGVFINGIYWRSVPKGAKPKVCLRGGLSGATTKRLSEARQLAELICTVYKDRILERSF